MTVPAMKFRFATPFLLAFSLAAFSVGAAGEPELVVRAIVEPAQHTYYAGQTIRLILELESRDQEVGRVNVSGLPDSEWAQTQQREFLELAGSSDLHDGVVINVRRFAVDYVLLQSGIRTFRPRATVMLSRRIQRNANSLFGSFVQSHQVQEFAEPVTLRVAPLPTPAPADACGLVGDFTLRASLSPEEASPGDLVNLRWTLSGIGNLGDFTPPAPVPVAGFKVYAPRLEQEATNDTLRISQVYVPESLSSTNIPAFSVSVFNPAKGAYETLTAGPFPLRLRERVAEDVTDFPVLGPASAPTRPDTATPTPSPDAPAPDADSFILSAAVEGRLAPSGESLRLRTLPAGTAVRVLERSGRWLRVESDGVSSWIPAP